MKTKIISMYGFAFTFAFLLFSILEKKLFFSIILGVLFVIPLIIELLEKKRKPFMKKTWYFDDVIAVFSIPPFLYLFSKSLEIEKLSENIYFMMFLCGLVILTALLSFIKSTENGEE